MHKFFMQIGGKGFCRMCTKAIMPSGPLVTVDVAKPVEPGTFAPDPTSKQTLSFVGKLNQLQPLYGERPVKNDLRYGRASAAKWRRHAFSKRLSAAAEVNQGMVAFCRFEDSRGVVHGVACYVCSCVREAEQQEWLEGSDEECCVVCGGVRPLDGDPVWYQAADWHE